MRQAWKVSCTNEKRDSKLKNEESDSKVLKGVECKDPAKSFLIFYAYSTIDFAREARAHHRMFAPLLSESTTLKS